MRIKDLKPNTEYATCDGKLVVTGDTVEGGWFSFYQYEDGTRTEKFGISKGDPLVVDGTKVDPWSTCNTGARKNPGPGFRYVVRNGVKVTAYDWDRDGKRISDKSVELVIKPADIPGLWSDYVMLHADRIHSRYRIADANAETRRLHDLMVDRFGNGTLPQATTPKSFGRDSEEAPAVTLSVVPLAHITEPGGRKTYKPISWLNSDTADKVHGVEMIPEVSIRGRENIDALLRALGKDPIFDVPAPKKTRKRAAAKAAPKKAGR